MNRIRILAAVFAVGIGASGAFAQSRSGVQLYDSTGLNQTAKFGWEGSKNGGDFFISTPNDLGQSITVKSGKLSGDGSGLSHIPQLGVEGLDGALAAKAAANHRHPADSIAGLSAALGAKADADSVYSRTRTNELLVGKSDASHTHTITGAMIRDTTIDSADVKGGAIGASHLRANSIDSTKIRNGSVAESDLSSSLATKINGSMQSASKPQSFGVTGTTALTITSDVPATAASTVFAAPANGRVILNSTATVHWYNTAAANRCSHGCITSTNATSFGSDGTMVCTPTRDMLEDLSCFAHTRSIPVTGGQSYTFRLMFKKIVPTDADFLVRNCNLTGIFVAD